MHFTIKPCSFTCNLNCDYCFYLPKGQDFLQKAKMSDEILEIFIKKYIESSIDNRVYFTWQGGEPLLMGIEFYQKVVQLQHKYAFGKSVENAIQTNATLLNDRWCEFLKKEKFLVGVSIDGPRDIHNKYRLDRHGNGSFDAVMQGIELLKKYKIEFNTLTCISKANYKDPLVVYKFLKDIGSTYMQFSEVIETVPENCDFDNIPLQYTKKEFALDPSDYGYFMADIFKYWVKHDIGNIIIRQFESAISTMHGLGSLSCVFEDNCPDSYIIEANGDVYECDQAVYSKYKVGNIKDLDLTKINTNKINRIKKNLSNDCKTCTYLPLCSGGCPKHRLNLVNGVAKSYFCDGYKILFKVMTPYLNAMVALTEQKIPYVQVKTIADKISMF